MRRLLQSSWDVCAIRAMTTYFHGQNQCCCSVVVSDNHLGGLSFCIPLKSGL